MLLVPADGVPYGLYVVRADEAGVTAAGVTSLDMTRQLCDLTLDGASRPPAGRGGRGGPAAVADGGRRPGAGILASEQLGLAERCLEMTVAYVKERRQFARVVGSFQAIKHRLADLYVAVIQARAAARYAADCLATGAPTPRWPSPWPRPPAPTSRSRRPRRPSSCTAGSASPGSTRRTCTSSGPRPTRSAFGTADAHRGSLAVLADLPPAGADGA